MDLRTYRVIYDLVDDMRASMEGRLGIVDERTPVGGADVRAVFGTGSKRVAGVMVTDGAVRKGCLGQVCRYTPQLWGFYCAPCSAPAASAWPASRSPAAPSARAAWARCAATNPSCEVCFGVVGPCARATWARCTLYPYHEVSLESWCSHGV